MLKQVVLYSCSVCRKPLELRLCIACAGSGVVMAGLFGERTCEVCGGAGRVLVCPDWLRHVAPRSPSTWPSALKPARGPCAITVRRTCPTCHGTTRICHRILGEPASCPTCGGTGWI